MEFRVSDVMATDIYYVRPNDSVAYAMRYLTEKGISAVPIIDDQGDLKGFVSDGDLMTYVFQLGKRHDPLFAANFGELSEEDLAAIGQLKEELEEEPIMNLATRKVVTVYADDKFDDACRFLSKKRIKKVPVIDADHHVVGVLSRSMMVRYLFEYNLDKELESIVKS